MSRESTPLEVIFKGTLAGMAGGLVIAFLMQKAQEKQRPQEQPRKEGAAEGPREKLVEKVSTGIFEVEPPPEERKTWAQAIHWGYSAFWGIVYGVVQSSLGLPAWLHGILLGSLVWAVGPLYMLPKMKLSPTLEEQPTEQLGMGWAFHVAFGLTIAATFAFLSRLLRADPEEEAS